MSGEFDQLLTAQTFATYAGLATAVWVVTTVLNNVIAQPSRSLGLWVSLVICLFAAVFFADLPSQRTTNIEQGASTGQPEAKQQPNSEARAKLDEGAVKDEQDGRKYSPAHTRLIPRFFMATLNAFLVFVTAAGANAAGAGKGTGTEAQPPRDRGAEHDESAQRPMENSDHKTHTRVVRVRRAYIRPWF